MKRRLISLLAVVLTAVLCSAVVPQSSAPAGAPTATADPIVLAKPGDPNEWRSALYPENWTPGYADSSGRFLHDFSYAGYMRGEVDVPKTLPGKTVDVTASPYNADKTGTNDVTDILQRAIDDVKAAGGGTVYLPEGTFKIRPPTNNSRNSALRIDSSNIIFKGAGIGKTFIYGFAETMRYKQLIEVGGGVNWDSPSSGGTYKLTRDIGDAPTQTISLDSTNGLSVGDWVIIRSDRSQGWIDEHSMSGFWDVKANMGTTFYRKITAINAATKQVEIDIPTRYFMKMRDNARLYKVNYSIRNTGLQDFSIANKQYPQAPTDNRNDPQFGEETYKTAGTAAYNVHSAFLIKYSGAVDCWARNIKTYRPSVNTYEVHMSANGMDLGKCRSLTIENCDFSHPQYEGGGGNGYGFNICSEDLLLKDCSSTSPRHAYSFKYSYSNGNVITNFSSSYSKYASDFHMYLSMSNLIDNQNLNRDYIEASVRPYGGTQGNLHGFTSSQTVFWNTNGLASGGSITSKQYKYGYIIGTRGNITKVDTSPTTVNTQYGNINTAPEDFKEGIGNGDNLFPKSLYYDQLERRIGRGINPFETKNLAEGRPATASSFETGEVGTFPAEKDLDGNTDTNSRWSSEASDNQWISVDLGKEYMLYGVRLLWEAAYGKTYRIETATSAAPDSWQIVHTQGDGKGGTESIKLQNPALGRYVRMQGLTRATTYGYSLYEFEVYGHEIKGVPGTFNATEWAAKSDEIQNATQDGKTFVGQLIPNSWLDYYINVPRSGKYSFNIRGAVGQTATRTLTLTAGETNLGTMNMVVDGSNWFNFSDNKAEFELQAGVQKLHMVANGSINIEDITIEVATPPEFKILSIDKSPTPAKRVRTTYTANVQGGEGTLKYNFYIFMGNKLTYFKKNLSVNNFSYVAPKSGNYSVLCICVDSTGKRVMLRDYFAVR